VKKMTQDYCWQSGQGDNAFVVCSLIASSQMLPLFFYENRGFVSVFLCFGELANLTTKIITL
jgi:hypothetical protein